MIELYTDHLRARVLPETGGCIANLDLILPNQKTCPVLLAPAMAHAVSDAAEVADAAKRGAVGLLEKLEVQTRAKPLAALAVVFGAGLLVSWIGRGRK